MFKPILRFQKAMKKERKIVSSEAGQDICMRCPKTENVEIKRMLTPLEKAFILYELDLLNPYPYQNYANGLDGLKVIVERVKLHEHLSDKDAEWIYNTLVSTYDSWAINPERMKSDSLIKTFNEYMRDQRHKHRILSNYYL